MPIEFRCTQCDRLLRTPDGTSGKDAKCPQCGALVRIPEPGAVQPVAPVPPPVKQQMAATAPYRPSSNPYESPAAAGYDEHVPMAGGRGPIVPSRLGVFDALERAWKIFTRNWVMTILVPLAVQVLYVVGIGVAVAVILPAAMAAAGGNQPNPLVMIGLMVTIYTTMLWLIVGMTHYFMKVARGEPARFGDVLGGPRVLPAFGTLLLVALSSFGVQIVLVVLNLTGVINDIVYGFAYLIFLIPSLVIWLMLSQALFLVIDQPRVGVFESLSLSAQLMRGNKLMMFLLLLLVGLVGGVVILFTCGVGALVVYPFMGMVYCVAYLIITGQRTADQIQDAGPEAADRLLGA